MDKSLVRLIKCYRNVINAFDEYSHRHHSSSLCVWMPSRSQRVARDRVFLGSRQDPYAVRITSNRINTNSRQRYKRYKEEREMTNETNQLDGLPLIWLEISLEFLGGFVYFRHTHTHAHERAHTKQQQFFFVHRNSFELVFLFVFFI